jgi:hypothetical protein
MNGRHPVAMAINDDTPPGVVGEATLVIRAWMEPAAEDALRIRMTFSEASSTEPTTVVTADAEQAVRAFRDWLARLAELR